MISLISMASSAKDTKNPENNNPQITQISNWEMVDPDVDRLG
jgi:hypothetical protein